MNPRFWLIGAMLALAGCATRLPPAKTAAVRPGLQPDGFTLLHNQWSIRPAGAQVALGDFPVNLAVDPSGRYAAVLHAGYARHEVRVIDLAAHTTTAVAPVHEAFYGIAFSADGKTLVCSGASDEVLHVFGFHEGKLTPRPDVRVAPPDDRGVVAGLALAPDGRSAVATMLFDSKVAGVDLASGAVRWTTRLDSSDPQAPPPVATAVSPNDALGGRVLIDEADPLAVVRDARRGRIYASLWGESAVAVLDARDGRLLARWPAGLHPNELLLTPDGGRLFVSNGGQNTVTVLATGSGSALETLNSALSPDDRPGSTPDSLALTPDGKTLFVANAYNNNLAVFDVSVPGQSRPIGFIPTGWFPTSVRVTPDGKKLLVISARGLEPKADATGSPVKWPNIASLYQGSLGIIDLPKGAAFDRALAHWTLTAQRERPAAAAAPATEQDNPVPLRPGGVSPIRYVIYIIKENRTYD